MTISQWRVIAFTLLGLGLIAMLGLGAWVVSPFTGTADGATIPDITLAADKSLGVNAGLERMDALAREEALSAMEAAGLRWVRVRFPWDAIEPEPGGYRWDLWDGIVDDVLKHKLSLIAVLDGAPAWARAPEDAANPLAPPREARDFGDWAAALAARYGDRIDYYQVWDEPNIAPHWGAREIDPVAYARLLREGAIRIRASDPQAITLAAALAPNVEPGGANMSELLFLEELYRHGAAQWFDVVAVQPYAFGEPLEAPPDQGELNWRRAELLRAVMERHGDQETAVWAVAWGSSGDHLAAAHDLARQDWPWLGPMLWAAWSPEDAHGEYALVDSAGQPLGAYDALQQVASAPVTAWPGFYPADHPSGSYQGDWRLTPSGADLGGSGDQLSIPFQGTRIDLVVRRGDYRAFLFVTVDGQPANALPRDTEGRTYVVLYDPLEETASVTLARELEAGAHTVEIVADRGWGQWAIAGWAVAWQPGQKVLWPSLVLGLAALGALGLTLHYAWPRRSSLLQSIDSLVIACGALDNRLVLVVTAATALLLALVEGTIPSLVVLGILALFLLLRPETGLLLVPLALPFYQRAKPLLGKNFSMVEILIVLTLVGWLFHCLLNLVTARERRPEGKKWFQGGSWKPNILDGGVIVLLLVGAISLFWAEHLREAAREFRTVILESVFFYFLLRSMVRRRQDAWQVADAWVLGGGLIALVGVGQAALGQNLITAEGVWRVRGLYGSPNNLALYLGRVFPLAIVVAAWWTGTEHRSRRWFYALAAGVMAVALFLTYSRGAWLIGVPAAMLFLAAARSRRTFFLVVALLVVAILVVVSVAGLGRLTSLLDTGEGTTFFRLQLWQSSWSMIRDHPLLGVGLDNFLYYYRTYYVLPTAWEEFNLSHPHNLVFDFWLRLGLPGLVVFLGLLVTFFRRGWRAYRRLADTNDGMLILGLLAGMVNFVAHGLVDNAFFLVDLAFVFMLMLALVQFYTNRH